MKKVLFFVIIILPVFISGSFAQTGYSGNPGAFLSYGIGCRANGMGNAYVAVSDDASAVYWNPAGLCYMDQLGVTTFYSKLFYDSQYSSLFIAYPQFIKLKPKKGLIKGLFGDSWSFGLGVVTLTDFFIQRNLWGDIPEQGSAYFNKNAFLFSLANRRIYKCGSLSLGITGKYISMGTSGLVEMPDVGVYGDVNYSSCLIEGVDLGLLFNFSPYYFTKLDFIKSMIPDRIGLVFHNVKRPHVKFSGGTEKPYNSMIKLGAVYNIIRKENEECILSLQADKWYADKSNINSFFKYWKVKAGTEVNFDVNTLMFSMRTGLNLYSGDERWFYGVSVKMPFYKKSDIIIDYSYINHPWLGSDHRFGVRFSFGLKKDSKYYYNKGKDDNSAWGNRYLFKSIESGYVNKDTTGFYTKCIDNLINRDELSNDFKANLCNYLNKREQEIHFLYLSAIEHFNKGHFIRAKIRAQEVAKYYYDEWRNTGDLGYKKSIILAESCIMSENFANALDILINYQVSNQNEWIHLLIAISYLGRREINNARMYLLKINKNNSSLKNKQLEMEINKLILDKNLSFDQYHHFFNQYLNYFYGVTND